MQLLQFLEEAVNLAIAKFGLVLQPKLQVRAIVAYDRGPRYFLRYVRNDMSDCVLDLNFFLQLIHIDSFTFSDLFKETTEKSQIRELVSERKDDLNLPRLQHIFIACKSFLNEGNIIYKPLVVVDIF